MRHLLGTSLLLLLAACGSQRAAAPATSTATVQQAAVAGAPAPVLVADEPAMSDEEILGVLRAVDDAELDLAELGRRQAASEGVRQYAAMMMRQHETARAHEHAIETSARLPASDATDAARHVKTQASSAVDELRRRSGAEFDLLFVETQIRAHRDVLGTIDRVLLPSARKDEVKTLVAGTRRFVEEHLAKAEALQRELAGAEGTGQGKATK